MDTLKEQIVKKVKWDVKALGADLYQNQWIIVKSWLSLLFVSTFLFGTTHLTEIENFLLRV